MRVYDPPSMATLDLYDVAWRYDDAIDLSSKPPRSRAERLWRSTQFFGSRGPDACTSIRRNVGKSEGDKRQPDRMEDAARPQAAHAQADLIPTLVHGQQTTAAHATPAQLFSIFEFIMERGLVHKKGSAGRTGPAFASARLASALRSRRIQRHVRKQEPAKPSELRAGDSGGLRRALP